jgi:hypothetical protein
MSDETVATPETVEIETTSENPNVTRPHVSAKPYDDELFDDYAEPQAEKTSQAAEAPEKSVEQPKQEAAPEEKKVDVVDPKQEESSETIPIEKLEAHTITRQINGKDVQFAVKDAIDAYMGKEQFNRDMDRRVTKISQREKAWESDQVNFKERIQNVINATQNGDFVTGIRSLAKLAAGDSDLDVIDFEKKYFAQLDEVGKVYREMTPEQRDIFFAKRALAEANEKNKKLSESSNLEKSRAMLQQKVDSLIEQHSLTPDQFWKNYEAIVENQVGEGKRFTSRDDVTTEDVISYTTEVKEWEKVYTAGEIAKVEDEGILDDLKKIASVNPNLTAQDLAKILQDAKIGVIADEKVVEDLNRKAGNSRFSQGNSTKKQNGKIEGYDDEDLNFVYRNQPKTYQRPKR